MSTPAFEHAFKIISSLSNDFHQHRDAYMNHNYQEAEVRKDFIDKFFKALGWDVDHDSQPNPYQQEVKVEKSQKQQGALSQRFADYAFYLAPNFKEEKFFVEAKKPSVEIKNIDHYFQTIRYGWNAGCPISILTDFEQFHIIDCRLKPDQRYVFNGTHKEYRYTDYQDKEKFSEIYWLFSHEAVVAGNIESYVAAMPKPKGKVVQKTLFKGSYQSIDDSFLEYIDAIRENLAKAFKKANPVLNSEELTEATQKTVDRLVFIRFLEDKSIEPTDIVSEWGSRAKSVWNDFVTECRTLDAKYNGVVFKKHFIDDDKFIGADESLFAHICSDVSGLNSPYNFNYIPIHILGSIYERFLGKVVVATDKRVHIEEKPEVRKAGGVYYTPKYIVDYIVSYTIGKLIEKKTPKEICGMHFADIACGSGSFLIGVYDYLLEYHRHYYTDKYKGRNETIDGRNEDYGNVELRDGQWVLTLKLKQDILLNNIYGVDIDPQAVEVTQLSLFLKMLDDETLSTTITRQGTLVSKVLPDLTKNIVCGNSLIESDIEKGQLFSFDELKKLNPFDYKVIFPKIMRNGGFDAVVGNPPWGSKTILDKTSLKYLNNIFRRGLHNVNIFALFVDKSVKTISKSGVIGLLIPKNFIKTEAYQPYRYDILTRHNFDNIIDFGKFPGVAQECIAVFISSKNSSKIKREIFQNGQLIPLEPLFVENVLKDKFNVITLSQLSGVYPIVEKVMNQSVELNNHFDIGRGIEFGRNGYLLFCKSCGNYMEKPGKENIKIKHVACKSCGADINNLNPSNHYKFIHKEPFENTAPLLFGSSIDRYELKPIEYYIEKDLPGIDYKGLDRKDKLYFIRIAKSLRGYYDTEGIIALNALNFIRPKHENRISLAFLLGIFNSKLYEKTIDYTVTSGANLTIRFSNEIMRSLPVKKIITATDKELSNQIAASVNILLELKQNFNIARTDRDKTFIENRCAALDNQIDQLVYQLYDLTEEEIKIVEGT